MQQAHHSDAGNRRWHVVGREERDVDRPGLFIAPPPEGLAEVLQGCCGWLSAGWLAEGLPLSSHRSRKLFISNPCLLGIGKCVDKYFKCV